MNKTCTKCGYESIDAERDFYPQHGREGQFLQPCKNCRRKGANELYRYNHPGSTRYRNKDNAVIKKRIRRVKLPLDRYIPKRYEYFQAYIRTHDLHRVRCGPWRCTSKRDEWVNAEDMYGEEWRFKFTDFSFSRGA